jgi:hypothetical protein
MAKSGSEVCLRMSEEEESKRERHYGDETFPINCITSAHKHTHKPKLKFTVVIVLIMSV